MSSTRVFRFAACILGFSLFGAGCALTSPLSSLGSPSPETGPKNANFENLSPEDAAKKMNLVGGNVIVMKQGFGGIGGKLAESLGFGGNEGTREVTVFAFAPGVRADIGWKLMTKVTPDPKDPKDTGNRQLTGSILDGKLQNAHKLFLPGYWTEGERDGLDTSIIWVSQDVYADLTRNKVSTLDLGILDPVLTGFVKPTAELTYALNALKKQAESVGQRKDVFLMNADTTTSTYALKVNGKTDVTVQAIKARNWFGEIVVLANPQNPLVLKVTLNPLILAAIQTTSGGKFLENGLGYHITELKDIQE